MKRFYIWGRREIRLLRRQKGKRKGGNVLESSRGVGGKKKASESTLPNEKKEQ